MEYNKKKILVLSTDTLHHRYFINSLESQNLNILSYIFETGSVKPKFKIKNFYKKEENNFEKKNFFKKIQYKIKKDKVLKVKNINSKRTLKFVKKLSPDIGIVFGCRKIHNILIKKFKHGLINIHRGVINKYRGLDSDMWAIYKKDFKNIGVCLHMIDKDLDTGPIIKQARIRINKKSEIYHLRYKTTVQATKMAIEILKKKNYLKTKVQKNFGEYYSFMPHKLKLEAKKNFDNFKSKLK